MGFIRKEIGEREKKLLEDFSIEEKELALPFLLEDEKRGIFLCVKQFRIGEGKYQVLAMILGGHLLEFRLEEERADRYPVRNEESKCKRSIDRNNLPTCDSQGFKRTRGQDRNSDSTCPVAD